MRAASTIVAQILDEVASRVRPGVTTAELDALAEELTLEKGARPAFKGYTVAGRVYPASICISINDEVVHGVPTTKAVLRAGDIVGLDFGVCYRGYFGDAARTVPVGRVAPEAERLMAVTSAALHAGIEHLKGRVELLLIDEPAAGLNASEVDSLLDRILTTRQKGVSVVVVEHNMELVMNVADRVLVMDYGQHLFEGVPAEVYVKEDGWTAATRDGRLSAHFEHSVAVTGNGPYILTLP